MPPTCPSLGRAGAANHPRSAVSSGQPRTTTPQVNPPVRWQVNRSDLAYNDDVSPQLPRRVRPSTSRWSPGPGLTLWSRWEPTAPLCTESPHWRAIHSSPDRRPADNHGQRHGPARPAPFPAFAGGGTARSGFASRESLRRELPTPGKGPRVASCSWWCRML
jgi:hypothetical protein